MRKTQVAVPAVLDPRAVYTRLQATAALGLKPSTLATEIRRGRLRVSRRAGRYFILGKWLLEWIRAGERKRPSRGGTNGVERSMGIPTDQSKPGRAGQ
jgi:hypothetical protein